MSVLVVNKCQILWLKLMHHIQFSWGSIPDFAGAGAPPEPPIPRGLPAPSTKSPTHALGHSGHSALPASISDPLGLDTRLGDLPPASRRDQKALAPLTLCGLPLHAPLPLRRLLECPLAALLTPFSARSAPFPLR